MWADGVPLAQFEFVQGHIFFTVLHSFKSLLALSLSPLSLPFMFSLCPLALPMSLSLHLPLPLSRNTSPHSLSLASLPLSLLLPLPFSFPPSLSPALPLPSLSPPLSLPTYVSIRERSAYNNFTICTEEIAECLLIPWPNPMVEDMFLKIHATYFHACPSEELSDPPPGIVFALVMTPICLIPVMVMLVVLKTKDGDRSS